MNPPPSPSHDDGLEWLRDLRRKMCQASGGDLKKLGDRCRRVQSEHPGKVFNPRESVLHAARLPKAGC